LSPHHGTLKHFFNKRLSHLQKHSQISSSTAR
jgi:hypothetical protein